MPQSHAKHDRPAVQHLCPRCRFDLRAQFASAKTTVPCPECETEYRLWNPTPLATAPAHPLLLRERIAFVAPTSLVVAMTIVVRVVGDPAGEMAGVLLLFAAVFGPPGLFVASYRAFERRRASGIMFRAIVTSMVLTVLHALVCGVVWAALVLG